MVTFYLQSLQTSCLLIICYRYLIYIQAWWSWDKQVKLVQHNEMHFNFEHHKAYASCAKHNWTEQLAKWRDTVSSSNEKCYQNRPYTSLYMQGPVWSPRNSWLYIILITITPTIIITPKFTKRLKFIWNLPSIQDPHMKQIHKQFPTLACMKHHG